MEKHKITVCIVHYRKLLQLKKTIDSLLKNTHNQIKIKILNNGFTGDGIKEYLNYLKLKPNFEIIFSKKNLGCSHGRKILTSNINSEFVLMLDDDIYVNRNWDKKCINMMIKDSKIGAFGFSLFRKNGDFWITGGSNIFLKGNLVKIQRLFIDPKKSTKSFIKVDNISAGAMLYRYKLNKLVDWDENYFIGFEDLEKGLSFKKTGYKFLISIKSKFIHDKVSEDPKNVKYNESRRDYHALRRSYLHFLKKTGYRLEFKRHFFYKYVCLLPNPIIKKFVFLKFSLNK